MNFVLKLLLSTALFGGSVATSVGQDKTLVIGNLSDMSGIYADLGGPGSTVAAQLAVEDSGLRQRGWKIDVIAADHQNKPDVASSIARRWIDVDKVDVFVDVVSSGVAIAVGNIAQEKNAVMLTQAASSDLTNSQCTPNTVQWAYDTYMLANSTGSALAKGGGDSWFFLTADYTFGTALERDTAAVVQKAGGKIVGSARHPLNTSDFSSYLLQAQGSKAKVIGLANGGADTTNSIKQASEFGIMKGGQKLAGLLVLITDVHALGLSAAQGLSLTETFYWDMNDATRAFSKRFAERMPLKGMPSMVHAAVYASLAHYLKAVETLGEKTRDGAKIVAKMKELPTDDPLFGKGLIQASGRKIHPAYLFEVKSPAESKGPWDYYKVVGTTPAEQAFRPLAESVCPLVKK